ncbi:hypothetical protein RSOLAG22IIIB_05302 [Rhizoctonia solani]|uniref:Hypervirulence associated protein TUDOR domain-containing protein n=1 Tax=Rhizoctonia solani TaxID=456999 RepID=A0A0K6G4I2_9AGAM|nr:hypothetical protein RSOLAG22IIIB_05302 [Rhizoctonia solani]
MSSNSEDSYDSDHDVGYPRGRYEGAVIQSSPYSVGAHVLVNRSGNNEQLQATIRECGRDNRYLVEYDNQPEPKFEWVQEGDILGEIPVD